MKKHGTNLKQPSLNTTGLLSKINNQPITLFHLSRFPEYTIGMFI